MKKSSFLVAAVALAFVFASCNKEECSECHYDGPGGTEVELGEKCGDELETLEAGGYAVDGQVYTVHCHGH